MNINGYKASRTVVSSCSGTRRVLSTLLVLASFGTALISKDIRNVVFEGKRVKKIYTNLDFSDTATANAIHQYALSTLNRKPKVAIADFNFRCNETLKFYERKSAGLHDVPDLNTQENIAELERLLKAGSPHDSFVGKKRLDHIKAYRAHFANVNRTEVLLPKFTNPTDEENYVRSTEDLETLKLYILSVVPEKRQRELLRIASNEGFLKLFAPASSFSREWFQWANRHFPKP